MEFDPELQSTITEAMLEVERDLSLPTISLVNKTSFTEMKQDVRGRQLKVRLDRHFLAKVPNKHLQQSKELLLRKQLAEKEKTISLLLNTVELQESTNAVLLNALNLLTEQ